LKHISIQYFYLTRTFLKIFNLAKTYHFTIQPIFSKILQYLFDHSSYSKSHNNQNTILTENTAQYFTRSTHNREQKTKHPYSYCRPTETSKHSLYTLNTSRIHSKITTGNTINKTHKKGNTAQPDTVNHHTQNIRTELHIHTGSTQIHNYPKTEYTHTKTSTGHLEQYSIS
jgi:hypothetical protein